MASLKQSSNENEEVESELLIAQVIQLHAHIAELKSLRPSKQVNTLLTQLVNLCLLPSSVDVETLPNETQLMRESLIDLCGRAEGLLELEFANFLIGSPRPLDNLSLFPYYGNYVKLASLEYNILSENGVTDPKKVAFVGSGPMPLTSFVLSMNHFKSTHFDNYDIDGVANNVASQIVASDDDLGSRMKFKTSDILDVREELEDYDCIFLAALVGMNKDEKRKIIQHVYKYMMAGGFLLVRSVYGARAFLYPVIEEEYLEGFEILSVFHPTGEVVNSVILVRKPATA